MRKAAFIPILCIGSVVLSQYACGMEAVTTCTLGSDKAHKVELLRDHAMDRTAIYYLSKDGAGPVRIYHGDEDQSRGDNVEVACVGTNERAFVISGEFNSNFIKGVAIRYNSKAKRWERVEFAERTRPASLYLDADGMKVLIPNPGRNESPKRYIIYRYDAHKGESEQTYSDHLPKLRATHIPGK